MAVALGCLTASCALSFPDYDLEETSSTTATTGSGGTGGAGGFGEPGSACELDSDCLGSHCLLSNTGEGKVCCATDCVDMGPESCGKNGKCDAGGMDCALYSAGVVCDEPTCADGVLTAAQCSAAVCAPGETTPCQGGLACGGPSSCAEVCKTSDGCANPAEATPAAECNGDNCSERPRGAPCDADSQCQSGACGTTGTGRCCSTACPSIEGACGPTGCDANGDCVFPEQNTACGSDATCMNGNLTTLYCNGSGSCSLQSTQPCLGHLACASATTCHDSCLSNDATGDERCPAGYWCDGATCQQASWDEGSECLRDGQCSSNDCTATGLCTAAGCDVDEDGFIRDDPHCVGNDKDRDCDDNDARAHPGQTDFFDTPRASGGYDFDCNGTDEPQEPTSCACIGSALLVPPGAEGCGVTGTVRTCFFFFLCGVNDTDTTATQLCR